MVERFTLGRVLKADEKIRRYAGCKVGDKIKLIKNAGKINKGTYIQILDIKCNDKQRISEPDLINKHIEVCKGTFQYKIDNDTWVTYDKLGIDIQAYRPSIANCYHDIAIIVVFLMISLFAIVAFINGNHSKWVCLTAICSAYMALAFSMSLYENKLSTNGNELKIVDKNDIDN